MPNIEQGSKTREQLEHLSQTPAYKDVANKLGQMSPADIKKIFKKFTKNPEKIIKKIKYPWNQEEVQRLNMISVENLFQDRADLFAIKDPEKIKKLIKERGYDLNMVNNPTNNRRNYYYEIYRQITQENVTNDVSYNNIPLYHPKFTTIVSKYEELFAAQSGREKEKIDESSIFKPGILEDILDAYGNETAWNLLHQDLDTKIAYYQKLQGMSDTYGISPDILDATIQRMYMHENYIQYNNKTSKEVVSSIETDYLISKEQAEHTPYQLNTHSDGSGELIRIYHREFLKTESHVNSINIFSQYNDLSEVLIKKIEEQQDNISFTYKDLPFTIEDNQSAKTYGRMPKYVPFEIPTKSLEDDSSRIGPNWNVSWNNDIDLSPDEVKRYQETGQIPNKVNNENPGKTLPKTTNISQEIVTPDLPHIYPTVKKTKSPIKGYKQETQTSKQENTKNATTPTKKVTTTIDMPPLAVSSKTGKILLTPENKQALKDLDKQLTKDPNAIFIGGSKIANNLSPEQHKRGNQRTEEIQRLLTTPEGRKKIGGEGEGPDPKQIIYKTNNDLGEQPIGESNTNIPPIENTTTRKQTPSPKQKNLSK